MNLIRSFALLLLIADNQLEAPASFSPLGSDAKIMCERSEAMLPDNSQYALNKAPENDPWDPPELDNQGVQWHGMNCFNPLLMHIYRRSNYISSSTYFRLVLILQPLLTLARFMNVPIDI